MDFNNLRDQVSNLTLYDVKAGVRKVQNAVMNYTEMEAKVREATNNEPWGASSTLMQEIANGTHSYQLLNEIMPMIYKRFTEKTAEEWRQIYKSLQLLEFLVKNGSERVIDDARSHLSLLRMLRQFHYIDQNGKDQGVNVRNRAQELAKLLSDVDAIRAERKKARANRNKFGGIEGGMRIGGFSGGSSMGGGFGSEDNFGGYSGRVYGDGGGFGGNTNSFQDSGRRGNRFEEYDEYNEGTSSASSRRKTTDPSPARVRRETKKPEPPKQPEPDLFDFGEDEEPATTTTTQAAGKKPAGNGLDILSPDPVDDDEFDDFQSAPATNTTTTSNVSTIPPPTSTATTTSSTQFAAPQPVSGSQGANLNDLVGFSSMTPASSTTSSVTSPMSPSGSTMSAARPQMQTQQPPKPTGYQAAQPNYFTSVQAPSTQPISPATNSAKHQTTVLGSAAATSGRPASISAAPKKSSGGDAFGSLWSSASAGAGIQKSNSTAKQGPALASMAKEKASAGIWGAPPASGTSTMPASSTQPTGNGQKSGSAFDDLLG